jgi:hypothetical protein
MTHFVLARRHVRGVRGASMSATSMFELNTECTMLEHALALMSRRWVDKLFMSANTAKGSCKMIPTTRRTR